MIAVCAQASPQPTFRSRVVIQTLDVIAVDDRGQPVRDLQPSDLLVEVSGRRRRVTAIELLGDSAPGSDRPAPVSGRRDSVSNRTAITQPAPSPPVSLVFLIDDESFDPGEGMGVLKAAVDFAAAAPKANQYGVGYTSTNGALTFASDFSSIAALVTAALRGTRPLASYGVGPIVREGAIGIVEAIEIGSERNPFAKDSAIDRLCWPFTEKPNEHALCVADIERQSVAIMAAARQKAQAQSNAVLKVLTALSRWPGIKHLVLVSGGIIAPGEQMPWRSLQRQGAAASVIVHVLYVRPNASDVAVPGRSPTAGRDAAEGKSTLANIAGASGGTLQEVSGHPQRAFDRIAGEMLAVYRIGVELDPADLEADGLNVKVRSQRQGVVVRTRNVLIPAKTPDSASATSPDERLKALLGGRDMDQSLPLSLKTYVSRDAGRAGLRLLIAVQADGPGPIQAAYVLLGGNSDAVSAGVARDRRAHSGQTITRMAVSEVLPPGEYTLHLAALDDRGRGGSIEHRLLARLNTAGAVVFSDPVIGTPQSVDSPRAGDDIEVADTLSVAIELYASTSQSSPSVNIRAELFAEGAAAVATSRVSKTELAAGAPSLVKLELPVTTLAPGTYTLGVQVGDDANRPLGSWRGSVRLSRATSMSRARAAGAAPVLQSEAASQIRGFTLRDLLRDRLDGILDKLAARTGALNRDRQAIVASLRQDQPVAADALPSLTAGGASENIQNHVLESLAHLLAGRVPQGHAAVNRLASLAPDFGPTMFLLGVCHAASGRDAEAAAAWQMATLAPDPEPATYVAAIDAWLRLGRPSSAEPIVLEGLDRWPTHEALLDRRVLVAALQGKPELVREITSQQKESWSDAAVVLRLAALRDLAAGKGESSPDRRAFVDETTRYLAGNGAHKARVQDWLSARPLP